MLSNQEKSKVFEQLKAMYNLFGHSANAIELEMVTEMLAGHDFLKVKNAIFQTARSCKFKPKPADILEHLEAKNKNESQVVAAKITGAISQHGWNNPDDAKKTIGELGWRVVTLLGGWKIVCASEFDQLSYLRHQAAMIYDGLIAENEKLIGQDDQNAVLLRQNGGTKIDEFLLGEKIPVDKNGL